MSESEFEAALEEAAALLSASAFPLIAGLGADVAGVVAALRLAERLGGAVDHAASGPALREAAVLHDVGLMGVSPGEARQRADTILVVGDAPLGIWPELADVIMPAGPTHLSEGPVARTLLALSPNRPALAGVGAVANWIECRRDTLPGMIGAMRARAGGRPIAAGADMTAIDDAVARMKAARFGIALWSSDEIDALAIEMLTGLVKDLNAETRWSGISVGGDISAAGATIACGWAAGYPLRVGFGRGDAEHDPWRFEARRLVASGEADAVVWVSAFGEKPPRWLDGVSVVHVGDAAALEEIANGIRVPVGRPARDHDATLFDRRTGTLVHHGASARSNMPSAADALNGIYARLAP
jgi:formylmethanofuran dehydrogenase subunit B